MTRSIARFLLVAAIGILAGAASAPSPRAGPSQTAAASIGAARQAVLEAERAFGASDRRLIEPLKTLARLLELQRDYAAAEETYRRALSIAEHTGGPHSEEAAELKLALMAVTLKREASPKILKAARPKTRSLAVQEAAPPPPAVAGRSVVVADAIPFFPWPPPKPSTSYVLPNIDFARFKTVGEVSSAIISALEQSGYVERSFFQTGDGGVALVTRLETIALDGAPASPDRWPSGFDNSPAGFVDFIRGLFYVEPGHYRVIVFILQEKSFSVSNSLATGKDAETWLTMGMNKLPAAFENRPFGKDSTCTALIYEFTSDGTAARGVVSSLTGKQHLQKAGVLAVLEKQN